MSRDVAVGDPRPEWREGEAWLLRLECMAPSAALPECISVSRDDAVEDPYPEGREGETRLLRLEWMLWLEWISTSVRESFSAHAPPATFSCTSKRSYWISTRIRVSCNTLFGGIDLLAKALCVLGTFFKSPKNGSSTSWALDPPRKRSGRLPCAGPCC